MLGYQWTLLYHISFFLSVSQHDQETSPDRVWFLKPLITQTPRVVTYMHQLQHSRHHLITDDLGFILLVHN